MSSNLFSSQVGQSLNYFCESLGVGQKVEIKDGALTARVIGEFSAGKTRLIRELLNDIIPAELYPVSSLERQTKLQLEITYGEKPTLKLIQKSNDKETQVKVISRFSKFPERHQIDDQYSAFEYRLRLEIPEQQFILPEGDCFREEKVPMKLFLIDTPGWNSGEDSLVEGDVKDLITGEHNLGLVYVSSANRLDSQTNVDKLKEFLEVLRDSEFLETAHLVFVITHCESENHDRFEEKATDYVKKMWEDLGEDFEDLTLRVMCVDFNELSPEELESFRADFWWNLLEPLGEQKSIDLKSSIESKVEKWDSETQNLIKNIKLAIQKIEVNRQMIQKAYLEGEFIKGLNMTRLMYLSDSEVQKKVLESWLRQVSFVDMTELKNNLTFNQQLEANHPLEQWWTTYFLPRVQNTLNPVENFFKQFLITVKQVTERTSDLNQHFEDKIYDDYLKALFSLESSFCHFLNTIEPLLTQKNQVELIANLLSLSMVEARFTDHCRQLQNA